MRTCRPRVRDLSRSGVALEADRIPAVGAVVSVGRMKGHVVRILDQGMAVQFVRLVPLEMFDDEIELQNCLPRSPNAA